MSWPTDPAEQFFGRGGWGWDGTAWRKLAMVWGYTDTYAESIQENSDVAGTYQMELATVPAGEVWRVEAVGLYRAVNAGLTGQVQLYDGSGAIALETVSMPAVGVIYNNSRPIILKATQYIIGRFAGATVGEACILLAWGYKMAVL